MFFSIVDVIITVCHAGCDIGKLLRIGAKLFENASADINVKNNGDDKSGYADCENLHNGGCSGLFKSFMGDGGKFAADFC